MKKNLGVDVRVKDNVTQRAGKEMFKKDSDTLVKSTLVRVEKCTWQNKWDQPVERSVS